MRFFWGKCKLVRVTWMSLMSRLINRETSITCRTRAHAIQRQAHKPLVSLQEFSFQAGKAPETKF